MRCYVIPNLRIPLRIDATFTSPKHSAIIINIIIITTIHETVYFEALVIVNVHTGFITCSHLEAVSIGVLVRNTADFNIFYTLFSHVLLFIAL